MINKKLGILIAIFAVVIMLPVISALDTKITVKTLENHRISIVVRGSGELSTLESFHKDTGTGALSITTSSSKTEIDLITTVRKDGVKIINEKFEGLKAGEEIVLQLLPGNVKIIDEEETVTVNETEEEEEEEVVETNETQEEQVAEAEIEELAEEVNLDAEAEENLEEINEEDTSVTGSAVSSNKTFGFTKVTYYIIGAIFLVSAIAFTIFTLKNKKVKTKSNKTYINFKVTRKKGNENSKEEIASDEKILEVEKKIMDAKKELENIKNKKKRIEDAKRRFEESKKELEDLEKE
jgi:preprotein translocase subunit SecG